jgi:hypothetical protein
MLITLLIGGWHMHAQLPTTSNGIRLIGQPPKAVNDLGGGRDQFGCDYHEKQMHHATNNRFLLSKIKTE